MKLENVRSYPIPRYPTAVQFHEEDKVIRYLPRRWRGKRIVGQVLVFTAMTGLCSCTLGNARTEEESPAVTEHRETEKEPWYTTLFGGDKGAETKTETGEMEIPLFVHGEGRGSFGCESVVPPVFLSEDEAAQVIRETAREYGLDFSGSRTVESGSLPYTNIYMGSTDETYEGELVLDGYDAEKGIGYEFVSQKDVAAWHKDTGMAASVESYDMKDTAERLTGAVRNTAVFYDPGMDYSQMPDWSGTEDWDEWERAVEEYTASQKERIEADLRAQVVDFIEWLKAQGVV